MNQQIEQSVIRILTPSGAVAGAGFLVSERLALTCAHVVADSLRIARDVKDAPVEEIHLDFPLIDSERRLTGRVVRWIPIGSPASTSTKGVEDIAVIEIAGNLPSGCQRATLRPSDDLWDHDFRAFGFPAGYDTGVWADGKLKGGQANGWIQIEGTGPEGYFVEPGFSGGAIVESGRVVSEGTSTFRRSEGSFRASVEDRRGDLRA